MNEQKNEYGYPFEKPEKSYIRADAIIALILFVFGYLASRWTVFGNGTGLGTLLLIITVAVIATVYTKVREIKIAKGHYLQLALIIILSAPLVLSSDGFIKFLVSTYVNISFVYWFFSACGGREKESIDGMLFFDLIKSTLLLPFSCFADIFRAIGKTAKSTTFGKKILLALLGFLIAIIPTAIVTSLLISADDAFSNLTEKLYTDLFSDLGENIFYLISGIPIAMYIFGMLFANVTHEKKDSMTREQNEKTASLLRFVPSTVTCMAITPIVIVYILFFFSQMSYFVSAFSGIRPEDITYAEYARKGFFELCTVSVINALIIICSSIFTKRNEKRPPAAVRVYTVILSVFTLALIAIALSKMFMYIGAYGLSLLRIYTTWFMILLALVFVFILIKQICSSFNFARTLAITFTLMFAVLIFSDTSAITARYNIYSYKTGKLDSVDIWMMYDLSDSAVEYVIPLTDDKNPHIAEMAKEYIEHKKELLLAKDNSFANFNISTYRAKRAIEEYYSE